MLSPIQRWLRITLFNLLLVALIGFVLRYKIAYSLLFVDQKHLLHAHSHFAFAGWITMALMALMVAWLSEENGETVFKKYQWILYANLVTAYGMLFSFPFEGYGKFSISFATLSIIANYIFAIQFWRDLNKMKKRSVSHYWFKAALFFNILSSLGAFGLSYMMATKDIHQNDFLAASYFYLHFQYNGWFFFACMGLLTTRVLVYAISAGHLKKIFWLFSIACIPAYFLSALWMPIPLWVYTIVIIAAIMQITGWAWMLSLLKKQLPFIKINFSLTSKRIFGLSAIALSIKLLLQLGSTIPSLSNLSFGFRPIVIGYLHLVLLGVISLFILGYMIGCKFIFINKTTIIGTSIFVCGIIINEVLLMIHGVSALNYINVPYINESLLAAAFILFCGMLILNISQINKSGK